MNGVFNKAEPVVLGFGGSGHEWAASAYKDGKLVAISEERLSRKKYGLGTDLLKGESRNACLKELNSRQEEVTHAVACDLVPKSYYFPFRERVEIINHHLAHAWSAFAMSGLTETAILVVDNAGSILEGEKYGDQRTVETISLFKGDQNGIHLLKKQTGINMQTVSSESDFLRDAGRTTNSLGDFYRSITLALGFGFCSREGGVFAEDGKTMGLSSYGDDRYIDDLNDVIELKEEGVINYSPKRLDNLLKRKYYFDSFNSKAAFARAAQHHFERALLHLTNYLHKQTGLKSLCIAGGCALNSVANGRVLVESDFSHVYVPPAPSDDGISIGCTAYGVWKATRCVPRFPQTASLGPSYSDEVVFQAIEHSGLKAFVPDDLPAVVGKYLSNGDIVGWFQGRSEFGPRALGHRSILALPQPGYVRDILNHDIKSREWFRPFAPMVTNEGQDTRFNFPGESPYMSFVSEVLKSSDLPAATHVDNTARLQTVKKEMNPSIHQLLLEVEELTGAPVLLNTSFNAAGLPIVETPMDAIIAALEMKLDILVLNNFVLELKAG
ncbi:carbamoyltransferase [Vibrio crassostreae]|nr:carbamoyltransferase [Vibrio crassostreae]CAK2772768.1 carbamoyltransferase [Vibrio crassostreae]CAK3219435.1 carbamoyltransferase [Vibrio crassostreae]CAK3840524.1 carbamoyltransferase [Vibrio crassostreae]